MKFRQLLIDAKKSFKPYLSQGTRMLDQAHSEKNYDALKFMIASTLVVFIMLDPSIAMAAPGDVVNKTNFETMIQSIIGFMTGTIAKSVAVLAVVVLGFMAMAGKLAWDVAGKVILGIILIFSATQIVELFITNAAA